MDRDDLPMGFMLGIAVAMAIAGAIAAVNGLQSRDSFEREAVQHGAATWTVDDEGNRVFKWRESK